MSQQATSPGDGRLPGKQPQMIYEFPTNISIIVHESKRFDSHVVSTFNNFDETGNFLWMGCRQLCNWLQESGVPPDSFKSFYSLDSCHEVFRVLELGCGTALPSLLVGKLLQNNNIPGKVTMSDSNSKLFTRLHQSISDNNLRQHVQVKWLDFGKPVDDGEQFHLVIASEIIYPTSSFITILQLLHNLLKLLYSNGQFVMTYVKRSPETSLVFAQALWIYSNQFDIQTTTQCQDSSCILLILKPIPMKRSTLEPSNYETKYISIPQQDKIKLNEEFAKWILAQENDSLQTFLDKHFPNLTSNLTVKWENESFDKLASENWLQTFPESL
jgi:hypothetical protein